MRHRRQDWTTAVVSWRQLKAGSRSSSSQRLAQIRDGALDGAPTGWLKILIPPARFLPQPIFSLEPAQGDLKPRGKFELGSDEQPPKQVIRVPLFSFRDIESHPGMGSKQFGVDHALVFCSKVMNFANQRQLSEQFVR